MKREQVKKAFEMIRDGINILLEEGFNDLVDDTKIPEDRKEPVEEDEKPKTKKVGKKEKVEKVDLVNMEEGNLEEMSFTELKKLAKSLKLDGKGNKEELIKAILDVREGGKEEEVAEVDEEPKKKPVKKLGKKELTKEDEDTEEDLEEDVEVEGESEELNEEDEGLDIDVDIEELKEVLNSLEVEEIADILKENNVIAKGKKQALIDSFIVAVKDGKINVSDYFDSDDEDTSDEEETDEQEDGNEVDFNNYDNEDMTKERKKALKSIDKTAKEELEDIEKEDLVDWLSEFYQVDKSEYEDVDLEDLKAEYINCQKLFINDEGEEVESEEPYTVNGIPFCCGHPLEVQDDKYVCTHCNNEYEIDEE